MKKAFNYGILIFVCVIALGCTARPPTPTPTPHVRPEKATEFVPPAADEYSYIVMVPAPRKCTEDENPAGYSECTYFESGTIGNFGTATLYGEHLEEMLISIHGDSNFYVVVDGERIESELPTGWIGAEQRVNRSDHEVIQVDGRNGMRIDIPENAPTLIVDISFGYGQGEIGVPEAIVYIQ